MEESDDSLDVDDDFFKKKKKKKWVPPPREDLKIEVPTATATVVHDKKPKTPKEEEPIVVDETPEEEDERLRLRWMRKYRMGDMDDDLGKLLEAKFQKFNPQLVELMKRNAVTKDQDVLMDLLWKLLPLIFSRIKLEVLDIEQMKDVYDWMNSFIMDLSEKEKGLTGETDDGVKTTIDIETIFAMLEAYLKKFWPKLIINDLDKPAPPPPEQKPKKKPLSFEEHVLLTIKEYEDLRDKSQDPNTKRYYDDLIEALLR